MLPVPLINRIIEVTVEGAIAITTDQKHIGRYEDRIEMTF